MLSHAVRLPDTRVLSYLEYGDPDGKPLFLLHGAPGSSAGWSFMDEALRKANLRAIAIDRPGIGLSTWQPRRTLLDWPKDLAHFADALGIEQFPVLGWSGGGPYSLACAYALPQRITVAGVVAGTLPLDWAGALEGLNVLEIRVVQAGRVNPRLGHAVMEGIRRVSDRWPERAAKWMESAFSDADRRTSERFPELLGEMESFNESYRQGSRGVARDYYVYGAPWGFDPGAIRAPVKIWHGDDDLFVPLSHGQRLAERIPGATLHVYEGLGHLAPMEIADDLLAELSAADDEARAKRPAGSPA